MFRFEFVWKTEDRGAAKGWTPPNSAIVYGENVDDAVDQVSIAYPHSVEQELWKLHVLRIEEVLR